MLNIVKGDIYDIINYDRKFSFVLHAEALFSIISFLIKKEASADIYGAHHIPPNISTASECQFLVLSLANLLPSSLLSLWD